MGFKQCDVGTTFCDARSSQKTGRAANHTDTAVSCRHSSDFAPFGEVAAAMDTGSGSYSEPLDALMKGSLEFTKDNVVMFCRGDESRAKLRM